MDGRPLYFPTEPPKKREEPPKNHTEPPKEILEPAKFVKQPAELLKLVFLTILTIPTGGNTFYQKNGRIKR